MGYENEYNALRKNNGQILLVPISNLTLDRLLLRATDIEFTRQQTRWVTFESAHGVIKVPSLCDNYASLKFQTLISDDVGPNYVQGHEPTEPLEDADYYSLMRNFLSNYDGETVTVISEMFETFNGVIEEISHKVEGGFTDATYEVTIEGLR